MTGASKKTAGFTKEAQNAKYIRKRDIKQKDAELRKEDHICKQMVINICTTCRDKLQWRFKFDKYKPLTKPGNCQACKLKNITKAYRTYCDSCASKKKVCPGCCKDMNHNDNINEEDSDDKKIDITSVSTNPGLTVFSTIINKNSKNSNTEIVDDHEDEQEDENDEMIEDDNDQDEEECSNEEDTDVMMDDTVSTNADTTMVTSINPTLSREINDFNLVTSKLSDAISTWDERKYTNMAVNKYAKNRVIGKEEY